MLTLGDVRGRKNEIIASKTELQVETTSVFLRNSVLLHYIITVYFVCDTLRKGIPLLRDFVKYLIISVLLLVVTKLMIGLFQ